MKKIKVFFAAVVLLFVGTQAFAQNINVSGKVVDAEGNGVVGAALVLQSNSTVYTMTDINGAYKLSVPANGILNLSCSP